jgi:hypothetical protein
MSLLLAVAGLAAVGAMLLAHRDGPAAVDWVYADETNPIAPPSSAPDGTGGDPNGPGGAEGDDGDGRTTPEGGGTGGEPTMAPAPGTGDGEAEAADDGGVLGLSMPAQAGMSVGLMGLAFLALLPGRRMPEHLR